MSTLVPETTPAPHETLVNMTTGWVVARSLQVVVDFAVADALGDAPQAAAALAHGTGAHPRALARVLRLLASYGVFAVDDAGMVSHTAASRVLRADHPQSFKAGARLWGLPFMRNASEHFAHPLRTGRPAVEAFAPAGLFPYLAERPEEERAFGEAMASKAHVLGYVAVYPYCDPARDGVPNAATDKRLEAIGHTGGGLACPVALPNEFVGRLRPNERLRRGNRRRHVASVPAVTRHLDSDRTGVEFGATPGPAHARDLGCTYAWVGTEADDAPRAGSTSAPAGWPSRSCSTAGISPRPATRRPAETRPAPARTFS